MGPPPIIVARPEAGDAAVRVRHSAARPLHIHSDLLEVRPSTLFFSGRHHLTRANNIISDLRTHNI